MAKAWEVVGLGPDVPLERAARLVLDTRFREMMSYREGTILSHSYRNIVSKLEEHLIWFIANGNSIIFLVGNTKAFASPAISAT